MPELFGSKMPAIPRQPAMPNQNDIASAQRASIAQQMSRSGRLSTMMGEAVGGDTKLGGAG